MAFKQIKDLYFGFNDASNYIGDEQAHLFNKIFIKSHDLDKLLKSYVYFLIGEKGTGKTAFALYLHNNFYKNTQGFLVNIEAADYLKFVTLKKQKNLQLTDYKEIWKVIIHMLISKKIYEDHKANKSFFQYSPKFELLQKAIDDYYNHAFSPEIVKTFTFVEESQQSAQILNKYLKYGQNSNESIQFNEDKFQVNLMYIQRSFESALETIKLDKNYILFIDGIDIRPTNLNYDDYIECIRGLAEATWYLNNNFYGSLKNSKCKIKIVLLLRPDIFTTLDLHNLSSKFKDNSLILDWYTKYDEYDNSEIYKMADRLFSAQQDDNSLGLGVSWNHYLPFKDNNDKNSFILFLRHSMYRPRDFVNMLDILKRNFVKKSKKHSDVFKISDFLNDNFLLENSNYLLNEIKDQVSFYYTPKDYEIFCEFFQFLELNRLRFSYDNYLKSFIQFIKHSEKKKYNLPKFFDTPETLLQFLFELNIVGYIEVLRNGVNLVRWCYRERSFASMSPKVKFNTDYSIHVGYMRGLQRIIHKSKSDLKY